MKNSKLHTTEDKSNEKVTSSNSKSEDTPDPSRVDELTDKLRGLLNKDGVWSSEYNGVLLEIEELATSEPLQDTSLTEITAEYFMATDPDRVALQRKVLAWHKAERAKLFEQIRSEVIGDFDAHKAMKPQTMRIGNNGQIDHEWTDQDEDWKTIMIRDTLRVKQLEALTRLEQK